MFEVIVIMVSSFGLGCCSMLLFRRHLDRRNAFRSYYAQGLFLVRNWGRQTWSGTLTQRSGCSSSSLACVPSCCLVVPTGRYVDKLSTRQPKPWWIGRRQSALSFGRITKCYNHTLTEWLANWLRIVLHNVHNDSFIRIGMHRTTTTVMTTSFSLVLLCHNIHTPKVGLYV